MKSFFHYRVNSSETANETPKDENTILPILKRPNINRLIKTNS